MHVSAKALSSRSLTFVVVVVVDLVDIDLVDEQASLVDELALSTHCCELLESGRLTRLGQRALS